MRGLLLTAGCIALTLLLPVAGVRAQSAPEAPGITSVTAGDTSLTIVWSAPASDGGSAVTAYDLRYIRSDARFTADDDWTLKETIWSTGDLEYELTGLTRDTSYDLQVRAVNANGDGPWSDPSVTEATTDHGGARDTATVVQLPSSITGRIDPPTEEDWFKITLTERTDLWFYTTGVIDTVAELYEDTMWIGEHDDGFRSDGILNFALPAILDPGTYYVKITSYKGRSTGSYTFHTTPTTTAGLSFDTATTVTPGVPIYTRRADDDDENYFTFTVTERNPVWMRSAMAFDLVGTLYNSNREIIASQDDGELFGYRWSFSMAPVLGPGTYYLKVAPWREWQTRGYILHVDFSQGPGNTTETALPISLTELNLGRLTSTSDRDYFRVDTDRAVYVRLLGRKTESASGISARVLDTAGRQVGIRDLPPPDSLTPPLFDRVALLPAPGTYYIETSSSRNTDQRYVLYAGTHRPDQQTIDTCTAFENAQSDFLYGCQWHLNNTGQFGGAGQDINVEEVWGSTKGEGVNIAIVDDGLQFAHPDLSDNVLTSRNHSYGSGGVYRDYDTHGTAVAGVIAARDNVLGVRGVAPRASIYAYDLLIDTSDANTADALTRNLADTAISSNSWGNPDLGTLGPIAATVEAALVRGVEEGFGGKGISYVFASGNGADQTDNSNFDGYVNHYSTIAVCAVNSGDVRSDYSEPGANLWVCAPSSNRGGNHPGITTTTTRGRYRTDFSGTSASAPIVSGVVALMRATNPDLTWRDVKLILAASARKVDASDDGWEDGALKYGENPSMERYSFNHDYGFGMVDAGAAVALAKEWPTPTPSWRQVTGRSTAEALSIPDAPESGSSTMVSSTLSLDAGVQFTEFIEINVDMNHTSFRNLHIDLVSPSGAVSTLATSGEAHEFLLFFIFPTDAPLNGTFRFGSARHLGEDAAGEWRLRITDEVHGETGKLNWWSVTAYGHGFTPDSPAIESAQSGDQAITLTWSAPGHTGRSAITSYDLRHVREDSDGTLPSNWTEVTGIWSSGDLTYELTGLSGGYGYDLQVRAVNADGTGPWSETRRGSTNAVAPGAGVIDRFVKRSGILDVFWEVPFTGGSSITRHDLRHIRTDATDRDDDDWTLVEIASPTAVDGKFFRRISSLDNDVSYDFQVRAHNAVGTGDWSAVASATPELNVAPQFSAGETDTRSVSEDAALGTDIGGPAVATDGNSHTLTYSLAGGGGRFAVDSATGQLRLEKALDYETATSHMVTVRVTDSLNADGFDDASIDDTIVVTVEVLDVNEGFEATGPSPITWTENDGSIVGTYQAEDPEGEDLAWTVEGDDADDLHVNSGGQLRFREGPDYEAPADANGDNVYRVIVYARDAVNASFVPVEITVEDVQEVPVVSGVEHVVVPENGTVVIGEYSAEDPEENKIVRWAAEGPDAAKFELRASGQTRTLRFVGAPDFEARADQNRDNVYEVTVAATDASGLSRNRYGRLAVTVTVTNVNETPTIEGPAGPVSFAEHGSGAVATYTTSDPDGDTVTLSLSGSDEDLFTLANGVITFKEAPDFEAPADADGNNDYELTLTATDGTLSATRDVTVRVTDEDERGEITLSSPQPRIGIAFTATLEEADSPGAPTWSWQRSRNRNSGFATIEGATAGSYTPTGADRDHYLRVTAAYMDSHGSKTVRATSNQTTRPDRTTNTDPYFSDTAPTPMVAENARAGRAVGSPIQATDDEQDPLSYALRILTGGTPSFEIDSDSGQIRVATGAKLDYETTQSYTVQIIATDPFNATGTTSFTIAITNVDEPPVAEDDEATTDEDVAVEIDVLTNDRDPERQPLTVSIPVAPASGTATVLSDSSVQYAPNPDTSGIQRFIYRVSDGTQRITAEATVEVTVLPVNDAPAFPAATAERTVSEGAAANDPVGPPIVATDVDDVDLMYSLSGGGSLFEIEPHIGQISVSPGALLDARQEPTRVVTVTAVDPSGETASVDVTITVTEFAGPTRIGPRGFPVGIPILAGGGPPPGPTPSEEDFEWTVERDIEELDGSNAAPAGAWSNGTILWVVDNPNGAGDAVYAYHLASGERVEASEFELDPQNRAPRGFWSDAETLFVSDSGRDLLFAYGVATGERLPDRDIELATGNRDVRGIWSDGATMWVLNRNPSLFGYDLSSGALLAEYALDPTNEDPHGIWSDGVTVWVSDHNAKQLFAYALPVPADDKGEEDLALERVQGEDFAEPGRVGNNSPRGIWSDGDIMYVVDANDGKVYSYNMPDAIDARLASLTLSGVEIGEFDAGRPDYEAVTGRSVTTTTVEAVAMRDGATVAIKPADADEEAAGHQVALPGIEEVTVTVTSQDQSRTRVYRVALRTAGPAADCLRGAVGKGFSLVVYEGGSVEDLIACAETRHVTTLYALRGGEYVSYVVGAPGFVNARFAALYADGVPALTPLTVKSEGPATAAPVASTVAPPAACLQGEVAEGFSLLVYAGGSVDDLAACADRLGITGLYVLDDGAWLSYIPGAPDFVNRMFRELFPDGIPVATPLVASSG